MFQHRSRQHRILAILMLLGLLFQVQTVLACQMMGNSQPAEHCCCDHAKPSEDAPEQHAEDSCCETRTEFSLKEPDPEKEQLAVVQNPPAVELPEAAVLVLLAAIWHDELFGSASQATWVDTPQLGLPGNKTYLSTQRLRI